MSSVEIPSVLPPSMQRPREGGPFMNQLLAEILDAHGGVDRWRKYAKVMRRS